MPNIRVCIISKRIRDRHNSLVKIAISNFKHLGSARVDTAGYGTLIWHRRLLYWFFKQKKTYEILMSKYSKGYENNENDM